MGKLRTFFHYLTLGVVDSNEEVKRKNTPCKFDEELSYQDFKKLAIDTAKQIKRLFVTVEGHFVYGEVRTVSGTNSWTFKLDFNDYGNITGNYCFSYIENNDSTIPTSYARQLSDSIVNFRETNQNDKFDLNGQQYEECINCHADLTKQKGYNPNLDSYTCKVCGKKLFNPNIYSGNEFEDIYCTEVISSKYTTDIELALVVSLYTLAAQYSVNYCSSYLSNNRLPYIF